MTERQARLREVGRLFLRLGFTAFGGPVAHLALMEREVVQQRGWLTRDAFLDLLGLTQLLPGPNSTEMALHLGKLRAGTPGLLVAGLAFILPAAGMVGALAWAYTRFGTLPAAQGWLLGLKAALVAVVGQALWAFGKTLLVDRLRWTVALLSLGAVALGLPELAILLGAGLLLMAVKAGLPRSTAASWALLPGLGTGGSLFLTFLKIGSVLYGSGYVLLAFLRAECVVRHGWITERQLLDAVAVGQFTPGPVFTTATFVGFLIQGWRGAVLATVGIFLPAFLFVAASGKLLQRLQASPRARAFLDGVNAASLALMAAVMIPLGRAALLNAWTLGLAVASGVCLMRTRWNPTWILLGSGLLGWALGGR